MYTFPQQQKIFKELLSNNPSNKQCADCNTIGPTWASLNFGVFLCSNCSGAHRALGPTITRVKSTKLDQWQKQWMQCMQIGNKQLNDYWQSELGMTKKPRMGAGQPQLLKYATQKYVKKRFVKNLSEQDPLTKYKNGTYKKQQPSQQAHYITQKAQQNNSSNPSIKNKKINDSFANFNFQSSKSNVAVQKSVDGKNLNLLEFDFPEQPKLQTLSEIGNVNKIDDAFRLNHQHKHIKEKSDNYSLNTPNSNNHGDDEFSEYTQHGTSVTNSTNMNSHFTFEELFQKKSNDSSGSNNIGLMPVLHHTHSATNMTNYGMENNNHNHNMNMNYGANYHQGNMNVNTLQHQPIGFHNNMYNHSYQQHNYHSINQNSQNNNNIYERSAYMSSNVHQPHLTYGSVNNNMHLHLNQYQIHNGNNFNTHQPHPQSNIPISLNTNTNTITNNNINMNVNLSYGNNILNSGDNMKMNTNVPANSNQNSWLDNWK